MPGAWNKGKTLIDWSERVDKKLDGRFSLISSILNPDGETRLLLRCNRCGKEKTISSVSLRGKCLVHCSDCFVKDNAIRREERKKYEKEEKQRQKLIKSYKNATQMAFNFCKCGRILPVGLRVCEVCKASVKRANDRRKEHKRRMRLNKSFDSTITLEKLYKRDHGVCYLCNKTCDWGDFQKINGAFIVGGSYPTVEHVYPLCKSGEHSWKNVKLACFSCNSKKGKKIF